MKVKSILFFLIALVMISACNKKDNFNYPDGTVGISSIIYYPVISISGSRLIIVQPGNTYTDPGASATLNGKVVTYKTVGAVTTTPGVYVIQYIASNAQNYTATDWRTVVVIGADVAGNDFSGTYLRSSNGVTSTWTKTANGVYSVENPGGAASGVGLKVIAVNYQGSSKISIPQQISPDFGLVSSGSELYTATAPIKYQWIFHASGYGTSARTFVKQ